MEALVFLKQKVEPVYLSYWNRLLLGGWRGKLDFFLYCMPVLMNVPDVVGTIGCIQ